MSDERTSVVTPQIWQVGALCRAIADALEARFNPVVVRGEISGFSRAASGHCYFALKDEAGQIRCAMFRRAASLLDFTPRDGELVELRGRLGVYEPRGDLQLVVESMSRAGAGALFEQFLRLKARLESEGLFDSDRKRALPTMPRGIGLVTSPGAAALHDVVAALQRRVPHIPVVLAPASVQGAGAAAELGAALRKLYQLAHTGTFPVDVIVLVRGGGAIEDLWSFNDETLARTISQSPVPVVCGVGHETDFTIADFVADLRAPTPTAAAELVAEPRAMWLGALELLSEQLRDGVLAQVDEKNQRLDLAAGRLGRPSSLVARQRLRVAALTQRMHYAVAQATRQTRGELREWHAALPRQIARAYESRSQRAERAELRLRLMDPALVLQRGYAWISDAAGHTVTSVRQVVAGQTLQATLADGKVDLSVLRQRQN